MCRRNAVTTCRCNSHFASTKEAERAFAIIFLIQYKFYYLNFIHTFGCNC